VEQDLARVTNTWYAVILYFGPVRLSEFWRNLDGLEKWWRNL